MQAPRRSDWDFLNPSLLPDADREAPAPRPTRIVKHKLHWYQWIVYTVVLITCVVILIASVTGYMAAAHFVDQLNSTTGRF